MDELTLHRLGLTERPHTIQVTSISRKVVGGRDTSKLKFVGLFQPEQVEDPDLRNGCWHQPEVVPEGLLLLSDEPMFAADAKSLRFDITSSKTRLRLARSLGDPLDIEPAQVKLTEAVLCVNKELDHPPVTLHFEASGIPSEQLFAKIVTGASLGITFERKDVKENSADDPEVVSLPAAEPKKRKKKAAAPAEKVQATAVTVEMRTLNQAGLDSLPQDTVIGLETEPDAEGKVAKTLYTKCGDSGSCWASADATQVGSFWLLMNHFNHRFSIVTAPTDAQLPEWAVALVAPPYEDSPVEEPATPAEPPKKRTRKPKGDQ